MTDAEILTLVDRLERCLLGKEEFHHRDHLAVAVVYLYTSDLETAMDRMRSSLKRFAAHHGVNGLYHETLTRFWLLQVEQRLDRSQCLERLSDARCKSSSATRIWRSNITAGRELNRRKQERLGCSRT